MNIYAKKGTQIQFGNPNAGYDCDIKQAKKHLNLNKIYTVQYVNIGSFHSYVKLVEIPDQTFNTVLFNDIKENTFENLVEAAEKYDPEKPILHISPDIPQIEEKEKLEKALIEKIKEGKICNQIAVILNDHGIDNMCATPDWILAEYLAGCLLSYGFAMLERNFRNNEKDE
jgi:hypothetical protein